MARSPLASGSSWGAPIADTTQIDAYFSADVETDGPIPGPYSMLSFALVYAGSFDGRAFSRPLRLDQTFYTELKPISESWQPEALAVNGLDRDRLAREGAEPGPALTAAADWVRDIAGGRRPILVAYPLSFDWTWLYWYFVSFSRTGSPFNHSGCFDLKTAFAIKADVPIAGAGRDNVDDHLMPPRPHTHHALDDALQQAELFANVFEWKRDVSR
jgi:DNA polymerase III epsilon subunit-like protein